MFMLNNNDCNNNSECDGEGPAAPFNTSTPVTEVATIPSYSHQTLQ